MDVVYDVLIVLMQLVPFALTAALIGWALAPKIRFRRTFGVTMAGMLVLLTVLMFHPPLFCPAEYRPYLTEEMRDMIYEHFTGPEDLPLLPLAMQITKGEPGSVKVVKRFVYPLWVDDTVIFTDKDGRLLMGYY